MVYECTKLQNKQIEELNKYADDAAEVYMSLQEGNDRIMDKYGDVLSVMPNVAKQLSKHTLRHYSKTVTV